MNAKQRNEILSRATGIPAEVLAAKIVFTREDLGRAIVRANVDRLEIRKTLMRRRREQQIERQIKRIKIWG